MRSSLGFAVAAGVAGAVDLSTLPKFLSDTSTSVFPALKDISVDIYNNPELGLDEHHAHDLVVDHFTRVGGWDVTPHAYGMDTAFQLIFEYRPKDFDGELTTIGFFAEYDALVIGHACGHNHIVLNGITASTLASKALVEFDIPGRIIVIGTPDEENAAGKAKLNDAGAFDSSEVWMMAHPTSASAVQPMNARLNYFPTFFGNTHQEAVKKAYQAMVIVEGLAASLPGTASSAVPIENVGIYAVNVVQTGIALGVSGSSLSVVNKTVASILDSTYPNVTYVVNEEADGVAINIKGPGGHASETTKGALDLSVATFQNLSTNSALQFYLPGNTSLKQLDLTVDMRSRYTLDLPAVAKTVDDAIGSLANSMTTDLKYPALEVAEVLGDVLIAMLATPDYNLTDWGFSTFAPASTDASWVQSPTVDPDTHQLISMDKVVFHPNYNICGPNPGDPCAFNHEPEFRIVAGTEFSYTQTEIVARAQAQLAVELLANETLYKNATAILKN